MKVSLWRWKAVEMLPVNRRGQRGKGRRGGERSGWKGVVCFEYEEAESAEVVELRCKSVEKRMTVSPTLYAAAP